MSEPCLPLRFEGVNDTLVPLLLKFDKSKKPSSGSPEHHIFTYFHYVTATLIFFKKKNVLATPHPLWTLSAPTRDRIHTPLKKCRVLTTGLPGKSQHYFLLMIRVNDPVRKVTPFISSWSLAMKCLKGQCRSHSLNFSRILCIPW